MVAFILPANSASSGDFITNSLRFNDDDSPSLNKTFGSGNRKTFTFSTWVKRANITNSNTGLFAGATDSNNRFAIMFVSDALYIQDRASNSNTFTLQSNKLFRDPSAWYHIVVAIDTTQVTEANRVKAYVNSTQITSFSSESYPSQNLDLQGNTNVFHVVGARTSDGSSGTDFLDGYMSDTYFVDGSAEAPTEFGETNDNGVWIPKEADVTFGTNGFRLEFKETGTGTASASTIGADTSGNTNHLTSTNLAATDVTTDTPTNNFATLNPLNKASNVTLSEGNCKAAIAGSGQSRAVTSSIAVSSGKWYWEINYTTDVEAGFVGVITADGGWNPSGSDLANNGSDDNVGYISGGNKYINGSASSYGDGWDDGDIISVLLNIDDDEVIFYKNGTAQNGGTAISKTFSGFYYAVVQHTSSSGTSNFSMNFGNPPHSISSGNSDGAGYGNFEYAVPSGFYSLCTKNLAEFG